MCEKRGVTVSRVASASPQKGTGNQRPGTIVTSPKEVDSIIRKEYGEIYKGTGEIDEDPKAFAKQYM